MGINMVGYYWPIWESDPCHPELVEGFITAWFDKLTMTIEHDAGICKHTPRKSKKIPSKTIDFSGMVM